MQQFIVAKSFIVGEINQQLRTSQVVHFDGSTLVVGDTKHTAPGVSSAIRAGWLIAVDSPSTPTVEVAPPQSKAAARLNSQAMLDQYKVLSSESRTSDLPPKQPRPLIDFGTKVISDADEENIDLDDALPSLKAKKEARRALKNSSTEVERVDSIPALEVLSDGGEPTQLKRQPRRNILDTLPLVDTKVSVPSVEPRHKVFGGVEFAPQEAAKTKLDGLEVLAVPVDEVRPPFEAKRKVARKAQEESHQELAQSVGAEPLAYPMSSSVPDNWKNLSFRDRKAFVENTEDVSTLKSLLLLEKGAVKKFITSKLENLSNA